MTRTKVHSAEGNAVKKMLKNGRSIAEIAAWDSIFLHEIDAFCDGLNDKQREVLKKKNAARDYLCYWRCLSASPQKYKLLVDAKVVPIVNLFIP